MKHRYGKPTIAACGAAALLGAAGCSKKETPPEFEPPRKATPTIESFDSLKARYLLDGDSSLTFRARGRKAAPTGAFPSLHGTLIVDTLDLAKTRGELSVDLTALTMEGDRDAGPGKWRSQALNWFGLGSHAPNRADEQVRMAEFRLEELRDLSAQAAHAGQKAEPGSLAHDAGLTQPERRSVTMTVIGSLRIRSVRVRAATKIEAHFDYPAAALSGALPRTITVTTRAPLHVSLEAHEVLPRDRAGILIADDLKLLGQEVGREAAVSARLVWRVDKRVTN